MSSWRGEFLDVREMRAIELNAEELGFSEELMMENAGAWVARIASEKGNSFLVLAGKGGKGGDGLVAARHLALMGKEVKVIFPYKECEVTKESTMRNLRRAKLTSIEFVKEPVEAEVIIDALLGTGVRGAPRGVVRELIEWANSTGSFKVSIDLPSGMDPNTGECELCFEADLIVSVHRAKKGLRRVMDKVKVVEIGIPSRAEIYLGKGDLELAPRRERKGLNGRVAVIGGSERYQGAPWLSASAAFRAGADLVYVYAPVRMDFPELIWRDLEGDLVERLREDKVNVVVAGPGLYSKAEEVIDELLSYLESERQVRAVIDADGLKALARTSARFQWRAILTPHLGEASKLLGREIGDSVRERIEAAREIGEKYEACVILKGKVDVVYCEGKTVLNDRGSPLMTVGGTGDVLSGVAGAFLGRDEPWWAAKVATLAVSLAGEKCAEERGHSSPTCLIEEVPKVVNAI